MTTFDYSPDAMTDIVPVTVRGATFSITCCTRQPGHPSHWGFQDESETREKWWDIRAGNIVLDIGAAYGSYSIAALALGAALVVAWSPPSIPPAIPVEAITMRRSAWQNGFEDRLIVHEHGLWSQRGWLAGFDGPRPARFFDTREEARAAVSGQTGIVSVFPVKPLDAMLDAFDRVDWMKIDAEGCELAILQGAQQTLKRFHPKIITENHYHVDPECEDKCDAYLDTLGYKKIGTRVHHLISHSHYV